MTTSLDQYKWIKAQNGFIPAGALVGGKDSDGKELFVARVETQTKAIGDMKGIQPGRAAPHLKCAEIPFGNRGVACENYEVLVGKNPRWRAVDNVKKEVLKTGMANTLHVPFYAHARDETAHWSDAIQIGQDAKGQPLYCARVNYKGGLQLGKAGPHLTDAEGHFVAHFAIGKEELISPSFELLIGFNADLGPMK